MKSWANIAVLLKAKDAEGGLFVKATKGLPFLLSEGLEVTFVPPLLHMPRSARVLRVDRTHDDRSVVYFEGITTRDHAEQLAGHYCLVRRDDVPADAFREESTLVGFMVEDGVYGTVGRIVRIEENPAHPLLVIALEKSVYGDTTEFSEQSMVECATDNEVYIPLVEDFICHIDEENRVLHLNLPEGLLDL